MKATLNDGFELEINENCLDDWDLLEILGEIDDGNAGKIVKAAKLMLGDEGVKKLKDHFRNDKGKVPVSVMVSAMSELMESVSALKNS